MSMRIDTDNNFDFYPRSPCGERRPHSISSMILTHFYPRSPCGERLHYDNYNLHCVEISIHALLAESDCFFCVKLLLQSIFLSTLSLRRATPVSELRVTSNTHFYPRSPCGERHNADCNYRSGHPISIHALLAESDFTSAGRLQIVYNFYPRSPCGERRGIRRYLATWQQFLSTLSLRRATARRESRQQPAGISIHALLAESDHFMRAVVS